MVAIYSLPSARAATIFLLSALLSTPAWASSKRDEATVNCKEPFKLSDKVTYDLSSLDAEHEVSQTRNTPPSTMVDAIRFNVCADLKQVDGVKSEDQCPNGTRACLTKTNKKGSDPDRIVAVIPLAQDSVLSPSFTALTSPPGLSILLHGSEYPSQTATPRAAQSLVIDFICQSSAGDPKLKEYNGTVAHIEWKSPAGCVRSDDSKPPKDDDKKDDKKDDDGNQGSDLEEHVGSGIGWFFLVLLLCLAAYFGIGAYYNYSTYGASGSDLIPHRDFWREVPYMLKDVIGHLFSSVRSRHSSGRGGYVAM